jgi:hypothetical protein
VSGVTVTKAEVQCGGTTNYACSSVGDGKYSCTLSVACTNPVPFVNGVSCPITINSLSQSCKGVMLTNSWWTEYTPPTGWSEKYASIKCSDGRYFACPNNYGSKVGCPIFDKECTSPTAFYQGAPCPWASSLVDENLANSSDAQLSSGGIAGIVIALVVLVVVIVALVVVKNKMHKEEIV